MSEALGAALGVDVMDSIPGLAITAAALNHVVILGLNPGMHLAVCQSTHISSSCMLLTSPWPHPSPPAAATFARSSMQIIAAVTLDRRTLEVSPDWPQGLQARTCAWLTGTTLCALHTTWLDCGPGTFQVSPPRS